MSHDRSESVFTHSIAESNISNPYNLSFNKDNLSSFKSKIRTESPKGNYTQLSNSQQNDSESLSDSLCKHNTHVKQFDTLDKDIRESIKTLKDKLSEPNMLLLRKKSDNIKKNNKSMIYQIKSRQREVESDDYSSDNS